MEQNWEQAIRRLIQSYDETRGVFLPMEFKEQIEAVSTNMKQIKKTYYSLRPTKKEVESNE